MRVSLIKYTGIAFTVLLANTAIAQKVVKTGDAKTTKLDRSKKPVAGPAPEVKIGKVESFTLDNGLKVYVVENHKLPKVSFSMHFDTDPVLEGEKKGYVDFTGSLLGTATKNMGKDEIDQKVDFIGASLNTSAHGISGGCLKKHAESYLAIMSDVLLNPEFKQEELDKLKTQAISSIASNKTSPEAMAGNLEASLFYGKDHPYGEVQTEKAIENITVEDCKRYYDENMKPNASYLTIVGDVTLEEAKAMANKYFGAWQKGEVKANTPKEIMPPLSTRVYFIDKPGAPQSTITIGYPIDLKPGSPDEIKVSVMNKILGGGASARLFRNLRETYNFTYGAYSSVESDEFTGSFKVSANVRASATDSAINEFLRELNRIKSDMVTPEELDAAKKNMAGTFSLSLENPATVARFALNIAKYNLPADYYQTYLTKLSRISAEDVFDMATKYVRPEAAYIMVVGDKENFSESLKKYSSNGKVAFYDFYGNPAVALKPAPAGVTAQTVMDSYIKAMGGKENMAKIKDETVTMQMDMMGQKFDVVSMRKAPNMSVSTIMMGPQLLQKVVIDGKRAKQSGMMGAKEMTGDDLKEALADAVLFNELKYTELGYKVNLLGVDMIDDKEVYKVEIVSPTGKKSTEYYDTKSGLKLRSEEKEGDVVVISDFSDYKAVNGVMYAHKVKLNQGGQLMEMTATKIEHNKKLKDSEFKVE